MAGGAASSHRTEAGREGSGGKGRVEAGATGAVQSTEGAASTDPATYPQDEPDQRGPCMEYFFCYTVFLMFVYKLNRHIEFGRSFIISMHNVSYRFII